MIKVIKYFFQSLIIYFFFLVGRILGLKLSRIFFSYFFLYFAKIFKSKNIIDKNIENFSDKISMTQKKEIISNMWKNYGMTFIEYAFFKLL